MPLMRVPVSTLPALLAACPQKFPARVPGRGALGRWRVGRKPSHR